MQRIEPAQPQKEKPSYAKTVEQSLLVVRGYDKAAQHEKEIDEKPGGEQERHIVQEAVGVERETSHQARAYAAPAIQYHESVHARRERGGWGRKTAGGLPAAGHPRCAGRRCRFRTDIRTRCFPCGPPP